MIHRSLKPLFLQHPIPKQSPFVLALHAALAASQRTQIRNVGRITTTNHNYTMKSASGVATWHKCLERSPGVIHYCKFFGCKWKKDIAATSCHELPACFPFNQSIAPLRSGTSAFLSWTSFPAECRAPPGFRLISYRCDCTDSTHQGFGVFCWSLM